MEQPKARLTLQQHQQAINDAIWIDASPHEWPTVDKMWLLCSALIDSVQMVDFLRARLAAVEAERDAARAEVERLKAELQVEENNCPYPDFSCGTFAAERGIELRPAGGPTYATTVEHWQGLLEQLKSAQAGEARAMEALRRIHEGATRQLAEPRSVLDDDQYALTAIATECEAVTAGQMPALDWLAQQRAEAAAKAERCAENAALRKIVVDLHWMARRYADGRMSTAPEMFNDAVKALLAMGIKFNKTFDQIIWARNSMGRRYDGLTNAQATPGTPEALGDAAALRAGKGAE